MRLATIFDENLRAPMPVVQLPDGQWASAHPLTGSTGWIGVIDGIDEISRSFRQQDAVPGSTSYDPHRDGVPLRFLPPIPAPRTFRDFYAFEQHVSACRAKRGLGLEPAWYNQPAFYFSNPVSLIGHDAPVFAPEGSVELDFELELAVVIGRGGRDIPRENAWDHVAGLTLLNDFSARDLQRNEMRVGLGPSKGKDFATAVGPSLLTLDEMRDCIDETGRLHLEMSARLNGKEISRDNAASTYFNWPRIIEHASRDADLMPGDLLGSGTAGTGCILELGPENTGGWLKPGDVIELEIERLGILRTPIVARPASSRKIEHARETREVRIETR